MSIPLWRAFTGDNHVCGACPIRANCLADDWTMPKTCGGTSIAPAIMIGEYGADMITEDWC